MRDLRLGVTDRSQIDLGFAEIGMLVRGADLGRQNLNRLEQLRSTAKLSPRDRSGSSNLWSNISPRSLTVLSKIVPDHADELLEA